MRALHCLLALFLWNCEGFSIIMEVSYKTTFPDAGHSYTGLLISLLRSCVSTSRKTFVIQFCAICTGHCLFNVLHLCLAPKFMFIMSHLARG